MSYSQFESEYSQQLADQVAQMIELALEEDLNASTGGSDITAALIPADKKASGRLIAREAGVLCGRDWFDRCFKRLDPSVTIHWNVQDGEQFTADSELCTLSGNARAILTAERPAMNFLQTLSGTATVTSNYVQAIKGTSCELLDTRKTIPGLRLAQKYAVLCGGGKNHRIGLYDAYLIKENHIKACGGIEQAVSEARRLAPESPVEVEVESLTELQQAIDAGADIVMLDNFSNEQKIAAVRLNAGAVKLEASGNVEINTIRAVAETGVDYISVGAITKHLQAIDLSLQLLDD